MSVLPVLGFGLKVGHLVWVLCCWILSLISINIFKDVVKRQQNPNLNNKMWFSSYSKIHQFFWSVKVKNWGRNLLVSWVIGWTIVSFSTFWCMNSSANEKRKDILGSMCDERARMLQDQFNVSMNHVQAISILISTFHHAKNPSAIDQRTFAKYTERTAFERPLTSGVAYAVRVLNSEREEFERQQGWTIKRMDTLEQNPVHEDEYTPESLETSPIQEEYAPVIFAQDTIAHVVSINLLSGKEDRENIMRARESGKGVLTAPFRLLKTNRLGVILTFAVYKSDLPANATPQDRTKATYGYIGGVFDIESLVEKLLHQLASKQTILVNVYDTTNSSHPISMYGTNVTDDRLHHLSDLNFGDPFRKHEMHCRFKQKAPWPWAAILTSLAILVIALLVAQIWHATTNHIDKVKQDCREMEQLQEKAVAADVAKSQFLATVSHEIRTPMNGVLGMLHMLMDTDLDVTQQDYVRTALGSGKALVSLINEVLDQAKIESGKLALEDVCFDLRAILDDVLSLFSVKSQEKGLELAVCISDRVPEMLIGDPQRFRQIITNLMGNSIKFTEKGHIFVTVHLVEEVIDLTKIKIEYSSRNTLSGLPVADRCQSWGKFKAFNTDEFTSVSSDINLIVSVEDTGEGIPLEAQSRIFTPFMQVDASISRTHGGTGIGLSISKFLVTLMKGEIGFNSILNTGSTFTFTAVFKSNEFKSQKINSSFMSSDFNGMRALVVDNRPIRAGVSRYHIQRLGIHFESVPDIEDVLPIITSKVVNIILIEQEVWDKDSAKSTTFSESLQKLFLKDPPKIFVLANSTGFNQVTCGVYRPRAIVKPLRASLLAASLQQAMGVGNKGNPRNGSSLRNLLLGRKILVIDDNDVNLRVAAGALKKYGAEVVCADSGKKAILMLQPPHGFDACFMDIQMPEMDGFEATKRIRDAEYEFNNRIQHGKAAASSETNNVSNWHVPILAMTADVIQATHEKCLSSGMDGYVSKPFEAQKVYQEVSRFFSATDE